MGKIKNLRAEIDQVIAALPTSPLMVEGDMFEDSVVEIEAADKDVKQELVQIEKPELVDRLSRGKYVWVPKPLRDYIYVNLDIDDLFEDRSLYNDETEMKSVVQQRQAKNRYSVPLGSILVRLNEIKEGIALKGAGELSEKDVENLNLLVQILEKENDAILESFKGDRAKVVTLEQLHLLLNRKGEKVIYDTGETKVCFLAQKCEIVRGFFPCVQVYGTVYINIGNGIQSSQYNVTLPYFNGYKSLQELGIGLAEDNEELIKEFIARGKRYVELTSKPSYMQYSSVVTRKSWWKTSRFKARGRIMVDISSMRAVDPEYSTYFGYSPYETTDVASKMTEFTDTQYAAMSPYVYGFSFSSKVWGEFTLDDITDISFRDDAYDMLVMDPDTKDMVFALVDNSVDCAKDFIDGKGGGCIFLLAGPPGGGKTLTAEAIAEKLQRPLHMVGVGELGTEVDQLEENLRRILDIAASWNAVLLIDECDIFMESRTDNDIKRNAMVGVFLRLLEYYEGVLFLTSNRAGNIDEAFYSRISMSLYYDPLEVEARKTVWTNLLNVYGVKDVNAGNLAHYELNGRKIKNVIRIAKSIAASEKRAPVEADFIRVIDKESQFRRQLRHSAV